MDKGYKKKTIKSIIRNKMNKWINSIEDETLREKINNNGIIVSGGCIASMLQGESPNDYDVYFTSQELARDVATYYIKNKCKDSISGKVSEISIKDNDTNGISIYIKSSGVIRGSDDTQEQYAYFEYKSYSDIEEYFSKSDRKNSLYDVALVTSNAITLYGGIQLILRFTGTPEDIHTNFDFVHCTNYYSINDGVIFNNNALISILTKELKYIGSKYPICSLFRIRKFISRGFTITAGEITKIAFDISKLDLTNTEVLRDQLTGVDYAYFREVITILEQNTREIDRTYLFELINRVYEEHDMDNINEKTSND